MPMEYGTIIYSDVAAHRHHGYNEPVTSQLECADLCGSDKSIERLYTVKKVHHRVGGEQENEQSKDW